MPSFFLLGTGLIAALTFVQITACFADERRPATTAHPFPSEFIPVDTAHLMPSPDPHLALGVEKAFLNLSFVRPVEFTHAGDGSNRVFVVEQDGRIHVFPNQRDVKETKIFLDIRKQVRREHNEEGLLGLAFHPKFRENGEFFVFYSVTPKGSQVSRFKVSKDADAADPASEEKILHYLKPYGNHNGGSIKFGPDGFLYLGLGDGGAANDPQGNAQNLETLLGSILRIDIDRKDANLPYAIPKDNPFAGQGRARPEIYAYGVRNIWRLAFDRQTGDLWAADVGQDHHEEVNLITKGGNYGWNIREGKYPRDPKQAQAIPSELIEPVIDYPRNEGKSITGGVVYRGKRIPALAGAYLYADFMTGNIWALRAKNGKATSNHKVARTSLLIAAFGEDEAGEVCFTSFDGAIYRFRDPTDVDKTASAAAPRFPRTLTETKLFASVPDHKPAPGLIPYDVNVPLWSDGAEKDRFLALPAGASVTFKEREHWEFPQGTVIVKTFLLPVNQEDPTELRRLETRLWIHTPRGWAGVTYLWNEEQTEANLMGDQGITQQFDIKTATGKVKQSWYFPSRSDCQACHTHNIGFVLGWNTRQLNRAHSGHPGSTGTVDSRNQLDRFRELGLFKNQLPKPAAELEAYPYWKKYTATPKPSGDKPTPPAVDKVDSDKAHAAKPDNSKPASAAFRADATTLARAYLDANCAMCHSPGGPGNAQGARLDMRFHQPLDIAFPAKKDVKPADPKAWNLLHRISIRDTQDDKEPNQQMPPLATFRTDDEAIAIIKGWLEKPGSEGQAVKSRNE